MENNIEIVFSDGILTEEHLSALRIGETLELDNVIELRFKNTYFSPDCLDDEEA